jgi:uncharacterized protein YxeA
MKYNTLKTILMAIILIFVFSNVSWAGNNDHRSGKNQSNYNQNNNHQHYNNGVNNSRHGNQHRQNDDAYNNNHKQQNRHHNYNQQNHTNCYNSRSLRHGHWDSYHAFSPYRHFFSGFYYVPGFAFSFSTGGHR